MASPSIGEIISVVLPEVEAVHFSPSKNL